MIDYCLAHFLRGVVLRFIAHPEPHVVARPEKSQIPIDEADEQALISFKWVLSSFSAPFGWMTYQAFYSTQQRTQTWKGHQSRSSLDLVHSYVSVSAPPCSPFGKLTRYLWILPDYELGRLFESRGEWSKAREQFEIVMSGKNMEVSTKKGKGKVSLQVSHDSFLSSYLRSTWNWSRDSLDLEHGGFEE